MADLNTTDTSRIAFEHWYSDEGKWTKAVERNSDGGYKFGNAAHAWAAWQAARAALQPGTDQPPLPEAVMRRALEALEQLLACPEIADCDPRDVDEETREAERNARKAIRSIAAALTDQPSDRGECGWQDIATAPKDGKYILVFEPIYQQIEMASWGSGYDNIRQEPWDAWLTVAFDKVREPTHWMPLPVVPSVRDEQSQTENPEGSSPQGASPMPEGQTP